MNKISRRANMDDLEFIVRTGLLNEGCTSNSDVVTI